MCDRCHRPASIVLVRSTLDRGRGGAGAHRAESLISAPEPAYLRVCVAYQRPRRRRWAGRYSPKWRLARARCSSDAYASSGSSSARSTQRRRGTVRPSSSPEKRASARPGSRPSSRAAPATPDSRSSLGRSIDLVGTELPYQPFVEALRPLGQAVAGRRAVGGLSASGVRGDARAAHGARGIGARAARARGSALGGYLDSRSRRLPRAQSRRPTGSAGRDVPHGRALVGRPVRRLADGVRRSVRRSCSSSGRSRTRS